MACAKIKRSFSFFQPSRVRQHFSDRLAAANGQGSNQTRVGLYNERLALDFVRRHRGAAAAEIGRRTGLSAQTVSGIVRRLLAAGLLQKMARRAPRGVGQPSAPLALRGDGAYAAGIKIGRQSSEAMLVDFEGEILAARQIEYDHPHPDRVLPWARERIADFRRRLRGKLDRFAGVGVATPFGFGGWGEDFEMPQDAARAWRRVDLRAALGGGKTPTLLVNDATAACVAESEFAPPAGDNVLYFYVGAFVGGGVILNRRIFFGGNGNAGALGSMPVAASSARADGGQLIHHASLYLLARGLRAVGFDLPQARAGALSGKGLTALARWRRRAGDALARAAAAAASVIDFDEVVVDGALPTAEIERLTRAVESSLTTDLMRGLLRPRLRAGGLGARARCLGAAWLPLYARYAPAPTALLKTAPAVTV